MSTEVNDQENLNLSLEQNKVNVDFEAKIQKQCMMYLKICQDQIISTFSTSLR